MQLPRTTSGSPARDPVLRSAPGVCRAADDAVLDPGEAEATGGHDYQHPRPRTRHGPYDAWPDDVAAGARWPHCHKRRHHRSAQQRVDAYQSRRRSAATGRQAVGRGAEGVRGKIRRQALGRPAQPSSPGRRLRPRESGTRCRHSAPVSTSEPHVIRYREDLAPGQKFMRAQSAADTMINSPTDGKRSTQSLDADAASIWKAKDGASVLVRPIEPGDFERERRFVDGLSPRAGYQRLMSPRKPSDTELRRWTVIDPKREGALVAIDSGDGGARLIGVARYVMESEAPEAEFAIVLSDDWQGRGLGAHLLSRLIDLARRSGVGRLFGTTLSEN